MSGDIPTLPFSNLLVKEIPTLRAFAISLCGRRDFADDLVQETLVKAWAHTDKFEPGSNLRAWLFTILRNHFYSQHRKQAREVSDTDGEAASRLSQAPEQHAALDMADFREALAKLSAEQREILILVGASGLSYEEAAEIQGIALGTVKSRVNRARARLAELMGIVDVNEIGPDEHFRAVGTANVQA
jgi:RNA polymerase sigma-70 factor, ECF subfamily